MAAAAAVQLVRLVEMLRQELMVPVEAEDIIQVVQLVQVPLVQEVKDMLDQEVEAVGEVAVEVPAVLLQVFYVVLQGKLVFLVAWALHLTSAVHVLPMLVEAAVLVNLVVPMEAISLEQEPLAVVAKDIWAWAVQDQVVQSILVVVVVVVANRQVAADQV
jgi:hypothetical protein